MTNEIIIYQTNELSTRIEVKVDEDTVWLTQSQMAELFQTTSQNITINIHNIYNEDELSINGTSKDFLQVQKEVIKKVQIYLH